MNKHVQRVTVVALFILGVMGCATTETRYRDNYCRPASWTTSEAHVEACVAYGYRYFSTDDRVRYEVLDMDDMLKALEKVVKDYDYVTNYKYKELAKYIDEFKLRPMLEREKKILDLRLEHVRGITIKQHFDEEMGHIDKKTYRDYDIRQVLLFELPLQSAFVDKAIEDAREAGRLATVEQVDLVENRKYDHKDLDPNKPADENSYVWKPRLVSLRLLGYKVFSTPDFDEVKPRDNRVSYIEGYRVINGKTEKTPALKAFFPNPTRRTALVVIDSDTEADGSFGYEIPDVSMEVYNVDSAKDLYTNSKIIDALFPVEVGRVEQAPEEEEITVEIARRREFDLWEEAPTDKGWIVPFDYQNSKSDNYNILFEYAEEDRDDDSKVFKRVKHVIKKWHGATPYSPSRGNVKEYFVLKDRFAGPVKLIVSEGSKEVKFVFPNGETETGYILPGENIFVEDLPRAIAFTEGEKRWLIEREKDSDVYMRRMEISPND